MTKVYSYRRFSTPEQLQGDSLRRQTAMAAAWAAARGLELDEELTFEDLGVSAFRGKNVEHGQLGQFMRAIEDGLVEPGSYLLLESLDRLSRQSANTVVRQLQDIIWAGVTVVTLDNGKEYTTEVLDRDMLALFEVVIRATTAHEESLKKQARVRQAWLGKRQQVVQNGGALTAIGPGWLKLVDGRWQVIEDRAAVVRRIFEMTVNGMGVEAIEAILNHERVPCFGRAMYWDKTYIRKILHNAAVIGSFTPHTMIHDAQGRRRRQPTDVTIEGYFPAVVDASVWETVQAMRSSRAPATRANRPQPISHLLAGLAACPQCGSTMTRITKGDTKRAGKPKLVCVKAKAGAGCRYHSVDLETVERALIARLDQAAAEAPGPDEGIATQVELVEGEIAGTEDALDRLLDALEKAPDSTALVARLGDLEQTLSSLRVRHEELLRQALLADRRGYLKRQAAAVEALREEPLDRVKANAALRAAVKQIVVDYKNGTLDMHWLGDGVSSIWFMWPKDA
jgi:DNA invertase Pin-like site-specific DNA recombinase